MNPNASFPLILTLTLTLFGSGPIAAAADPPRKGALDGSRFRVVVSTDLGGSDEDDIQSMIHFLVYSDLFDVEGLVSSPPGGGRATDILRVIDVYAKDYPNLKSHSKRFPSPDRLREITFQGAESKAPAAGYREKGTKGSEWIAARAMDESDSRPLYVLVWGSITDVAQALHDHPEIKKNLRVYFIASWNRHMDQAAFRYIDQSHQDTWMVYSDTTFRGWYMGGDQKGDLGNREFIKTHLKGHGALGDAFAPLKKGSIKMGDSPSVAFLLKGRPDDPTRPGWGGQFVPISPKRPHWWIDNPDPALAEADKPGAKTVNRWRGDYLRDWATRMDWCRKPKKKTVNDKPASAAFSPDRAESYKTIDGVNLRVHIFEPTESNDKNPSNRAAIVFFFGGGWNGGTPKQFFPHCRHLADLGMVAMAAEYRVKSRNGTTPFECVKDGKSALRWVRRNAGRLGIDPRRIAAGGGSAGGHVAAAIATVSGLDEDADQSVSAVPNALVLFNPVFDNGPDGYGYDRVGERYLEISPIDNIRPGMPPAIVFLGTADSLIPVSTANQFQSKMQSADARSELILFDGQPHGFFNFGRSQNKYYTDSVAHMDRFLESLGFLDSAD